MLNGQRRMALDGLVKIVFLRVGKKNENKKIILLVPGFYNNS
jgi:hypothetical protein